MASRFVFVYGTLKRGEPNHHWLTRPENGFAKFLSMAETVKRYPLVIGSRYNIPFLLDSPGKGENVRGEVYEIDDKMLSSLDILEEHPKYYVREVEEVRLVDGGSVNGGTSLDCWMYFIKNFKSELLSFDHLKEYSSRGSHGKPYSEREMRDPSYHAMSDVLNS